MALSPVTAISFNRDGKEYSYTRGNVTATMQDFTTCILIATHRGEQLISTGVSKRSPLDHPNMSVGMSVAFRRAANHMVSQQMSLESKYTPNFKDRRRESTIALRRAVSKRVRIGGDAPAKVTTSLNGKSPSSVESVAESAVSRH